VSSTPVGSGPKTRKSIMSTHLGVAGFGSQCLPMDLDFAPSPEPGIRFQGQPQLHWTLRTAAPVLFVHGGPIQHSISFAGAPRLVGLSPPQ
jgi:hypothetical protein